MWSTRPQLASGTMSGSTPMLAASASSIRCRSSPAGCTRPNPRRSSVRCANRHLSRPIFRLASQRPPLLPTPTRAPHAPYELAGPADMCLRAAPAMTSCPRWIGRLRRGCDCQRQRRDARWRGLGPRLLLVGTASTTAPAGFDPADLSGTATMASAVSGPNRRRCRGSRRRPGRRPPDGNARATSSQAGVERMRSSAPVDPTAVRRRGATPPAITADSLDGGRK